MEKLDVSSLLRDDKKNIIFVLQSALLQQAAEENLELPVRQRNESLSWWVQDALIETKISLN